jgi:hypothetical protein
MPALPNVEAHNVRRFVCQPLVGFRRIFALPGQPQEFNLLDVFFQPAPRQRFVVNEETGDCILYDNCILYDRL